MYCRGLLIVLLLLISCGESVQPPDHPTDDDVDAVDDTLVTDEPKPIDEVELIGILETQALDPSQIYRLVGGAVVVPAGSVLTIHAGTIIRGERSPRSWLEVEPGGQLHAEGTVDAPIVFTSGEPAASQAAGDWGGLIIRGNALGHFKEGGDPDDSSGILRYVRVEYAGSAYGNGHFNGISLEYVGAGTIIEHLQVHAVPDDAIELYGGSVDLQHVVATGYGDDGIDWTYGYTGRIRYLVCHGISGTSDRGIEGDSNPDAPNMLPRARPQIQNATILDNRQGILLRNGTGAELTNCVIMDSLGAGLILDDTVANNAEAVRALRITHTILFGNHPDLDDTPGWKTNAAETADDASTWVLDPQLTNPANRDWRPRPGSPALEPGRADQKVADFLGAIGTDDWTKGWTNQ